jgi:4-amino-4-deoxy-L-arabinose transferase-like glycosyltransferase
MLSAADKESLSTADENSSLGKRNSVWLWSIVLAGAVLRLISLGYKSFWIDEIASVAIARRASPVFWHFLWHDEGNMAAYYLLLRPWLHLGYGEGTVRLLSVIPGIASIPLMYALARKLFDTRVAMVASLFLALNACAIFVSQEARAYSFVLFLGLLSTYLFVRLLTRPAHGVALAYAMVAGLSCYFHYFCVLVPAAHYVVLIGIPATRRPRRPLLFAAAIIAIVSAPILWLMRTQDTGHISWVQPSSWLEAYHLGAYLSAASGKAVGGLLLALNLVLVGFFAKRFMRCWGEIDERWRYLLVASLVATPVLLTLLVSLNRPAFYHRFLIICLPGWILMTALGAGGISSTHWRTGALAGVCALSLISTFILYRRITEDWKRAITELIARGDASDRVLYYEPVGEFAGENYRDWLPGGSNARPVPIVANATSDWEQNLDDTKRVWLVLYRANPSDLEVDRIQQQLSRRGLSLRLAEQYPGVTLMEFDSTANKPQ